MEQFLNLIPESPIVPFTILILVSLTIPPIFERLRLPGLVGLLFAGVVLGPNGMQVLSPDSEIMKLLSDIGKIYLMFVAGLEIDLEEFRRKRNRSLSFGLMTFAFPLTVGTAIGLSVGYGINTSILMGSLLASHTLLGYPIVARLGVVANESVVVTIGATIFTDIAALLVLAICISIHGGDFSATSIIIQLAALGIYAAIVLFGLDWAGKEYFRRTGNEESNQFLFVMLAVFLVSVGSQIINVDQIVGAFLAGLAVNDVIGHSPVEEKVEFVGSTLFIPFFFVGMGLLIDVPAFIQSLTTGIGLTLAIVLGLLGSKLMAATGMKLLFRYNWNETMTMWALSVPQVAATLAAALAAERVGLISEQVFNTVIVLMLVTSVLGPILTARFGSRLSIPKPNLQAPKEAWIPEKHSEIGLENPWNQFTVVVAVSNPMSVRYLVEMAGLLARHESGLVVPITITQAHVQMDEPQLDVTLRQSDRLLEKAAEVAKEFGVQTETRLRIDDDIAEGISRTAREFDASLIVIGWNSNTSLRARLLGNLIDNVFWSSHCPVAVLKLLEAPIDIHRILVPVKNITPQAIRTIRFAQLFADSNQAEVMLLQVCDRRTSREQVNELESELSTILASGPQVKSDIQVLVHDNVSDALLKASQSFDLVVLRSMRRRTAGGLAVSDVTTEMIKSLTCSFILFGEPHS
ncbi:cation:proton antiporter [Arthrospira platensis]|jgi:Kef-type K+ transport system membrane component KefB/nucleotide-binding universal stress UspA family protein|uniref:Na+/H+ antiporter n=1 Tax=Limnospira platensis NIES-46 TaxID=1236695 RepID=A0A5M3T9A0_LIMPL|nr:cation:proton antiporter [Arthrospira platensis]AMW28125.1 sodium:proton antiporter [Arthrospira platensis YZ]KDR57260.1 sodium:proton antiporter [Arthrospira platensis str. Paraca]MBD2711718.1 cation:proton antiporter [Arthrospira platensis FACHB-835]MDF2209246.1 cation:proton antiporter [Arthrospira platensis NCB002]MDT9184351.1 cation:proton antiporter [Limnospira sp. PMC 289.06]MDT9296510.1 cation:proton antiporter [Arthrospira platensis PCC 7345]MDT9312114.1 cation:proton antiporter 